MTALSELGGYGYTTRLDTWMDLMGTKVLVLFIGLYLGVVFLLASAAVLALQQLTQAADAAGQYRVLSLLGAPEKMRGRAADAQVALAFLLPLALALVHAAVGMTAANARHRRGGEGGLRFLLRRHRPAAGGGVRRVLPGHLPGQPPAAGDGPGGARGLTFSAGG